MALPAAVIGLVWISLMNQNYTETKRKAKHTIQRVDVPELHDGANLMIPSGEVWRWNKSSKLPVNHYFGQFGLPEMWLEDTGEHHIRVNGYAYHHL